MLYIGSLNSNVREICNTNIHFWNAVIGGWREKDYRQCNRMKENMPAHNFKFYLPLSAFAAFVFTLLFPKLRACKKCELLSHPPISRIIYRVQAESLKYLSA